MNAVLQPRDYQVEALDALDQEWADGTQRTAIVLPTGSGKTVIFAHLARERQRNRVLIIVDLEELIGQTVDKLRRVDRTLSVGVVRGNQNEGSAAVVVASIQTLRRPNRLAQIGQFGTIVVDECHMAVSDSYITVLQHLGAWVPWGPKVVGFTATMSRGDTRGLGDVWENVCFTRGIKYFIDRGHLVPPVAKQVITDLDESLAKVKQTGGDYNKHALGIIMTDDDILRSITDAYREHASDRQGVIFAPTVESAEYFAAGLTAAGFPAEGIFGSTPKAERKERHIRFRAGDTQIVASCTALAKGWDAPWCSAAVLARPSLHQGIFIQQIGRVLRPWPGKTDAMVIDVAGATRRHNLHALIELNETPEPKDSEPWDIDEDEPEEPGDGPPKRYQQAVGFEDVDLFAGTEARWKRTSRGVLFVSTKASLYFLAADGETWRVGKTPARGGRVEWLRTDCPAEEALTWAGQLAVEEDPTVASNKAPWRGRPGPPSPKMLDYAQSLGIPTQGINKNALSDAIDITLANRILAKVPV